jgi:hypothetical protein
MTNNEPSKYKINAVILNGSITYLPVVLPLSFGILFVGDDGDGGPGLSPFQHGHGGTHPFTPDHNAGDDDDDDDNTLVALFAISLLNDSRIAYARLGSFP